MSDPKTWRTVALNWGWQVIEGEGRAPRVVVAIRGQTDDPRLDRQAAADAALIAAAPELLAACHAALAWLGRYGEHAPVHCGGEMEIETALLNATRHAEHWED
jgi:hypothetical protein